MRFSEHFQKKFIRWASTITCSVLAVLCRRRAYAGLALSLVAYTLGFIALISLCRALFADSLSVVIADATSTWVSVPDSQVDLYRMLGMQEGSMADGLHQFRDLSDYHAVVGFIEGPLVWSAYGVGLVVIAALRIHIVALDLDSVIWALSQASTNNGSEVQKADGGYIGIPADSTADGDIISISVGSDYLDCSVKYGNVKFLEDESTSDTLYFQGVSAGKDNIVISENGSDGVIFREYAVIVNDDLTVDLYPESNGIALLDGGYGINY